MGFKSLEISKRYRTGECDVVKNFYIPCLSNSCVYKRAVGYFTSGGLAQAAKGLAHFIKGNGYMQLVASPCLEKEDIDAINEGYAERNKVILDRLMFELERIEDDYAIARITCLSALVATGRLEIKLALPVDEKNKYKHGIYHEKIGVFQDPNGDKVAFTGSSNETVGGLVDNFESILVFKSWKDPESRVQDLEYDFDKLWADDTKGIRVISFPEVAKAKLLKIRRKEYLEYDPESDEVEDIPIAKEKEKEEYLSKWRHQDEAVSLFIKEKKGILEMATGTGKTRTAVKILEKLVDMKRIESAIITCDGNDILIQWEKEILAIIGLLGSNFRVLKSFGDYHQLGEFIYDSRRSILIISRPQVGGVLEKLQNDTKRKLLLVHDEVHRLGSPGNKGSLGGKSVPIDYRLGLSATPEREYDEEGTKFITQHIGPVIFQFGLEDAIKRGILCEFDYYPLEYHLTNEDKAKLASIFGKKAALEKAGVRIPEEEIWTQISRVYKTSEAKIPGFREFLEANPQILNRCIVFVEEMAYGEKVLEYIHQYRYDFHTYYSGEDREKLESFSKGKINCLITCHRLSEGIDIKSIQSVFLFSSNRSKLETIQRMGRCLRIDPENPNKRANVIDFIRVSEEGFEEDPNSDIERKEWLINLSKIKRIEE